MTNIIIIDETKTGKYVPVQSLSIGVKSVKKVLIKTLIFQSIEVKKNFKSFVKKDEEF